MPTSKLSTFWKLASTVPSTCSISARASPHWPFLPMLKLRRLRKASFSWLSSSQVLLSTR